MSEFMQALVEHERDSYARLFSIENEIYTREDEYLRRTAAHGNVVSGWESLIDGTRPGKRASEKIFSGSSATFENDLGAVGVPGAGGNAAGNLPNAPILQHMQSSATPSINAVLDESTFGALAKVSARKEPRVAKKKARVTKKRAKMDLAASTAGGFEVEGGSDYEGASESAGAEAGAADTIPGADLSFEDGPGAAADDAESATSEGEDDASAAPQRDGVEEATDMSDAEAASGNAARGVKAGIKRPRRKGRPSTRQGGELSATEDDDA